MKRAELAYLAGLFDGEGNISIRVDPKLRSGRICPTHSLSVTVVNTNRDAVIKFHCAFGGSLVTVKPNGRLGKKPLFRWRTTANMAVDSLRQLLPFLAIKRPQAKIAIRFQTKRRFVNRYYGVPKNELQRRERHRQTMHRLNGTRHVLVAVE